MVRRLARVLLSLSMVALSLVGLAAQVIKVVLPEAVISAPNRGRHIDARRDRSASALRALGVTRALRVTVGPPRASLSCWIIDPPAGKTARGTVLVLHGIGDRKSSMRGTGHALAQRGFRAVLVDHRGHGRSSGDFLSYGAVETRDMRQLVDALVARALLVEPLGVVGFSYGAAVSLQLAGRDKRVRAAAAIAPFSDLRSIVETYLRRLAPLVHHLIGAAELDLAVAQAGQRGGFDAARASPLSAIGFAKAELLLVHGSADVHIPIGHSRRLLAAAPRGRARLVVIDGADHISVMSHPRMQREMLSFIERSLGQRRALRTPATPRAAGAP